LFVTIFSGWVLGTKIEFKNWLALALGLAGVGVATMPLIRAQAHTQEALFNPMGIFVLAMAILAVSYGNVYFVSRKFKTPRSTILAYQTFLGGAMMLPLLFWVDWPKQNWASEAIGSIFWMMIPVSMGAVSLYFRLLEIDPIRASFWLFLTPIFGFTYASLILGEPFTIETVLGLILVICGLIIVNLDKILLINKDRAA
jgi:drug/metabolite transporter (DMT)-like permease